MNAPTFYWLANGERNGNFGDILTPYILDFFKIPFSYSKSWKAPGIKIDAICVGSIIERAAGKGTIVLGSGVMSRHKKINPDADFRLVRGPYSRKRIIESGGKCPKNYGDPGLLLPMIWEESKKKHDVGIIPHLIDIDEIKKKYPNENIINLRTDAPETVAKKISECRSIVSSSLHGIITAHAYGIPAAWAMSNKLISKYSDAKFFDYYEYLGLSSEPSSFDNPIFTKSNININNIVKTFEEYAYEFNY